MNAGTSKTSWVVLTSVVLMASIAIIVIDVSNTGQIVQRHWPEQCRTAQKDRRKLIGGEAAGSLEIPPCVADHQRVSTGINLPAGEIGCAA